MNLDISLSIFVVLKCVISNLDSFFGKEGVGCNLVLKSGISTKLAYGICVLMISHPRSKSLNTLATQFF